VSRSGSELDRLTARERAVVEAAASGLSSRDIAAELYVSPRTVESHLGSVYRKLGVKSRAELLAFLARSGATAGHAPAGEARLALPGGLHEPGSFVGRDGELARLAHVIAEAGDHGPVTAIVGGEAGIGKSALIARAAHRAWTDGATVLAGRCSPDFGSPLQPVADALRPLIAQVGFDAGDIGPIAGSLAAIVPDLAHCLPEPLVAGEPSAGRRLLVDAVFATLAHAARGGPAILVIEDLHWADHTTLALLRELITASRPQNLVVMASFRDTELTRRHPLPGLLADLWREPRASRLELAGLPLADAVSLAEHVRGAARDPEEIGQLHGRTRGNPFFLLQMLSQPAGARPSLPPAVTDVVLARVGGVDEHALEVLTAAAVLGDRFDTSTLAVALQELHAPRAVVDGLGVTLERATQAQLLDESSTVLGRYRFSHDLVWETLVGELGVNRRAQQHLAAAAAIVAVRGDGDDQVQALAAHLDAAGDLAPVGRAAELALRAAQAAAHRHAPDDALGHVERGLARLPATTEHDEVRFGLLLVQADAHATRMDLTAHRSAVLDAVAVARRLPRRSALAEALARNTVLPPMGIIDRELLDAKYEAIEALAPGPDPRRVDLLVSASYQRAIGGDGWAAAHDAHLAVDEARALGESKPLAAALYGVAAAALGQPDLAAQAAVVDELTAHGLDRTDLPFEYDPRRFRALVRLATGDRPGFEADADGLGRFGESLDSTFLRSLAAEWRTLTALLDARLDDAEALATEVLAVAGDDPNFLLGFLVHLAAIRAEQDRAAEVLPMVHDALGDHPDLAVLRVLGGWLYAAAGDHDAALGLAGDVLDHDLAAVPGDWLRPATLAWLTPIALAAGPAAAADLARHLEPYRGQLLIVGAGTIVVGAADRFRGSLLGATGAVDAAVAALTAAAALSERVQAPALTAHTQLDHAELVLGGDDPSAGHQATEMIDHADATGRRHRLAWVRQRARELRQQL
jgi:DNA-binding CsgD family transcriptional regulator